MMCVGMIDLGEGAPHVSFPHNVINSWDSTVLIITPNFLISSLLCRETEKGLPKI